MRFNPLSDDMDFKLEASKAYVPLWPEGDYFYKILSAVAHISAQHNEMIKLEVNVINKQDQEKIIIHYLCGYSLRSFCKSHGMMDIYAKGKIETWECDNKAGVARVVIEKGKQKPDGTFWRDRNVIKFFVDGSKQPMDEKIIDKIGAMNDDIPF